MLLRDTISVGISFFLRLAEMIAVSGTAATHKLWLSQRQLVDRKEI